MAAYSIRILKGASRDLARLDKPVARRVAERVKWLAANLDDMKPEQYTGEIQGLYKFRVGDYRVIYQILQGERIIVIHEVGHRSEIYRRR